MRTTYYFLLLILFPVISKAQLTQTSWGPDVFGYTANVAPYAWVDISNRPGVNTVQNMGDDDSKGPFQIGFPFHYYWTDYSQIRIGSNGWIGFGNTSNIASCFPTIPLAGGVADNYLAPFMVDLNPAGIPPTGSIQYWTNFFDSFVVTFNNVPYWTNNAGQQIGSNTFQVVFNALDSSIRYQYNNLSSNYFQGCASDLVIGFENVTGAIGLQFGVEQVPSSGTAILIKRPVSTTFSVPDVTPQWLGNTESGAKFYKTGLLPLQTASVKNVGNTAITQQINITGRIRNSNQTILWTENTQLFGLLAGFDQLINFNTPATLSNAGIYSYEVSTSSSQDINPGNDLRTAKIVMVQAQGDSVRLSYATQGPPTGNQSWSGGAQDDGIGIYYEPPYYPAKISSVQVYIRGLGAVDTFWIKLYNDTGLPGALLDSIQINPGTYTSESWVTIPISNPVFIFSGGFYVAWIQGGAVNSIGSETTLNPSRRNFEILSGSWAEFRSNTTLELLMNVFIESDLVSGLGQVSSKDDDGWEVYPNPTSGTVEVALQEKSRGLVVYNLQGKEVLRKTTVGSGPKIMLNASELAEGMYLLTEWFEGGLRHRKLIKN